MPDQNPCQSNPRKYPALSGMGTEELERLLAQELDMPEDEEPDLAFLEAMTKTLRERKTEAARNGDVEEALERFHQRLEAEAREPAPQSGASQPVQARRRGSRSGVSRLLRNVAAVLAVVLAVCGTASAFGVNIFQTVAEWTSDTFSFAVGNAQSSSQADPYKELRSAVAAQTDVPTIPHWAPDGTVMQQDMLTAQHPDGTLIQALFNTNNGVFTIRVRIYDSMPTDYHSLYQKDESEVEILEINGVTHYILHNNSRCGATWTNGLLEVALQGDLTVEELEKMIDSIYE